MHKLFLISVCISLFCCPAEAQEPVAGPMLSAASPTSVTFWLQTRQAATVQYRLWPTLKPDSLFFTHKIDVNEQGYFIGVIEQINLKPGQEYCYKLLLNDLEVEQPQIGYFRMPGLAASEDTLRIAAGSCAFMPAKDSPDRARMKIFESIAGKQPHAMLWLGDNLYLNPADMLNQQTYMQAYTSQRAVPELQPVWQNSFHYAIWDDHDYGPNNASKNWVNKDAAKHSFTRFWPASYTGEGIYSTFTLGDAQFFMLDCRWFNTGNTKRAHKEYLGNAQMQWLFAELKKSNAAVKFICLGTQVLSTDFYPENFASYKLEKQKLLRFLLKQKIDGVFFLDGDRHFSELSKQNRRYSYPLYALTVSPLTSTPEKGFYNGNRLPGTFVPEQNFALITIAGKGAKRHMLLQLFGSNADLKWEQKIYLSELKF